VKSFWLQGVFCGSQVQAKKRTSEETVEHVTMAFQRSPKKSIRRVSLELNIPRSTVYKVLHKRLHLYAYKAQTVQALEPNDRPQRQQFAIEMLDRIVQNPITYRI
jgi:hypothetical protein